MNQELKQKKYEEGKEKIVQYLKECIDENGTLNITQFRNLHRSEYNKLSTYFGSIDQAVNYVGALKITNQRNIPSLVQKLAYAQIKEQVKTKNIATIAREYNVSRAGLNQLYKALAKAIDNTIIPEE